METTPKPTIDPESLVPSLLNKMRHNEFRKRIPKYDKKDYARVYRIMLKYRKKQLELQDDDDIEDPDPYDPSYVFYCFTGKANV